MLAAIIEVLLWIVTFMPFIVVVWIGYEIGKIRAVYTIGDRWARHDTDFIHHRGDLYYVCKMRDGDTHQYSLMAQLSAHSRQPMLNVYTFNRPS
jgi:hypothetical protein